MINADTGARARPGDKRTIWEAFLAGTEPNDTMYILDGGGVSPTHNINPSSGDSYSDPVDTEAPALSPGPAMVGPQNPNSVTTGTGGIY
ncbi:MAG: hypothetical protein LRZ85_00505 [Alphaproteobacteria bacterium]|nr:hypothetical protein [Alphaproteobacteria bacterium]MCD8526067.1 hypothetical protein [Alphaproteobacteria bacterium]MCD8570953.1 hypothetical protein [Alphaproteobacteria bacterium]